MLQKNREKSIWGEGRRAGRLLKQIQFPGPCKKYRLPPGGVQCTPHGQSHGDVKVNGMIGGRLVCWGTGKLRVLVRTGHRGAWGQIGEGRRLPGSRIWLFACGQWALLMVYRRRSIIEAHVADFAKNVLEERTGVRSLLQ